MPLSFPFPGSLYDDREPMPPVGPREEEAEPTLGELVEKERLSLRLPDISRISPSVVTAPEEFQPMLRYPAPAPRPEEQPPVYPDYMRDPGTFPTVNLGPLPLPNPLRIPQYIAEQGLRRFGTDVAEAATLGVLNPRVPVTGERILGERLRRGQSAPTLWASGLRRLGH